MIQKNFRNLVSASRKRPVYLLKTKDAEHGYCWYFLELKPAREDIFLKLVKSGAEYHIPDYARIITSGWGETPPEAVTHLLREEGVID